MGRRKKTSKRSRAKQYFGCPTWNSRNQRALSGREKTRIRAGGYRPRVPNWQPESVKLKAQNA